MNGKTLTYGTMGAIVLALAVLLIRHQLTSAKGKSGHVHTTPAAASLAPTVATSSATA